MPIFENEPGFMPTDGNDRSMPTRPPLTSPNSPTVNTNLGGFGESGDGKTGLSLDQIGNLSRMPNAAPTFDSPFQSVSRKELLDNKRYPMYARDMDLENVYGLQQSWGSQLANGVIKMGATGLGTFAQGFATIPNTISSIKGGVKELSNPDGYEASIDNWLKNVEDIFPNYYTRYEKEHPFLAAVPFMRGSANFWGDKFIKNLGFTAGAIGSALVQDAAIGLVTQGIGEIPLIANQVGKASLWLNKVLTGTNDLEKALSVAKTVGASEKALLGMTRLEQAAAYTKLTDGFKYGMSLYGSARTEAAVEARDGYNQVKKTLIEQYKLENLGQEPTGEDAAKIEEYATSAMNARFGANLAILTVSNAIQFDNLFKSFGKASKAGLGSSISKDIESAGKIGLKKGSLDEFEIKAADKLLGRVWDKVRPTLPSVFSEGIYEEGGQFAVEKGTYDYYTNKYKNPKNRQYKNDFDAVLDSTLKGLQAQFGTQEGIENMMIGGLTGMLTGAGMSRIDSLRGQGKDKRLQTALNMANMYGVTGVLGDKYADTVQSGVIAKEMEDAVASNDIFKYKNLKNDLFFKFVASRIPSGMHDVTIQQLEMLKDLPKEEFEKHFGMDFNESNHATVVSYVDSLIEKANHIKTVTDSLNNTFRNPFTFVNDPKSPQQEEENNNYQIFENFKQELAWTTTVAPDADGRLNSIQQDLININPLLTNDLVSSLTNKKSILELAKTYEQEAYRLGKTLTPSTIESDKKAIQNNIKALRTAAERINLAVQGKIDAVENLNYILNFELNNRQALKSRVIGSEFNEQIFNYSFDINRLNASKDRAREIYDTLATKEGFEKYFNDSKDASAAPDPNSDIEEAEIVSDEEEKKVEFENELGEKENIEIGRQYQVTQDRLSKINKLAEDNWEVTAPDGTVKYAATEEEARAIADDIDGDLLSLGVVNVIDINDNGTIKVQDLDGNIQNISPDVIKGYEKIQTRQERLTKFAESVKKFQDELELTSGDVNTEDFTKDFEEEATSTNFEDRKKGAGWLFISSKTASEDWEDPKNSAPHITRSREFLNKAQFFENRADLRVILVTYANEKALGLEGLTALSNDKAKDYKFTAKELESIQDVNIGFMAQVFVNSKGEYVDKDGKVIAKDADVLDHVIFQTMPITSLEGIDKFGKPYPLYRKQEKAEAAVEQKRYIALREKLMTDASGNPERYAFAISKGIGVTDKAGEDQFNAVDALLPVDNAEQIVATHKGLIQISITGTIQHNGIAVKVPKGRPTFVYGDTLVTLGNRKFNINSAETVFEILKLASDNIKDLSAVKAQMSYLQNVLYWKKPTEKSNKQNQIFIDENTMNLHIGNRTYDVSNVANLRDEIMDQLMGIYANINNNSLTTNFNTQFREFYVENGELKNRVWDNYQSYLLSNKFPDGSNRSTAGIPLFTNILKASDAVPYSFKQRYSTIIGLDLPVAPAAPIAKGTTVPTIGKYVSDGKTVNTVKLQGETISFKVDNTEFRDGIANQEMAGVTFIQDENWNKFVEKIGDQDAAEIEVVKDIYKELQAEEASPAPVVPTVPTAPVVSDKKADVILTIGTSGSGKSTWIKSVNKNNQFVVISPDEMRVEFTGDINDKSKDKEIYKEAAKRATQSIKNGKPVIFDTTNLTKEKRRPFIEAIRKELPNANIQYKLMPLDAELAKQRIKSDIAAGVSRASVSEETIDRHAASYKQMLEDIKEESITNYDAELAALEGGKVETPAVPEVPKTPTQPGQKSRFNKGSRNDKFRLVNKDEKKAKITDNDLTEFKKFHAEKLPNLPYEILENTIDAFDGRKAYGVFVDGIAKFHKGAIRGTEYHEIFHSVFNLLLSPEEQSTLLNEVRNRPGTFKDRITQKTITYKEATDDQLEDRIADEYADFRLGKVSAKTLGEKVTSIFRKILDLVKKFVNYLTGKNASNVDKLFDSIEKGKLKDRVILDSGISSIPKYRAVEGLTDTETHEFVQDMTILGGSILFGENLENIYDFKKFTGKEVFDAIESYYNELGYLEELGEQAWEELVQRTKENLRVLVGLRFNDEDAADVETESSNTKEYDRDPFSIGIKDASYGVKLLCGTLPKVTNETVEAGALPKRAETSIGGYEIMNYHQVMSTLLNKLSNTTGVDEMIEKLKDLAKSDKTYVRLIARLGGNNLALDNENLSLFDFANFNDNQWRLFIDFTQTFTKQNPETLAQYINGNEVYLGQANLYTAIENMQEGWIRNIRAIAKEEGSLIKYNPKLKIYESDADAFKNVDISTRDGRFAFLNKLGIDIPDSTILRLKEEDKKIIDKEADSIYTYLKNKKGLATLTGKTLDVKGKFAEIARVLIASTNPLADTVYQGVDGKTRQTYAQNNALSVFANQFNQAKSLDELLKARPQLHDVFAKHSLVLKKGGRFFDKDGNKKPGAPKLTVDVFTGELNEVTDKGASTVKLSRGDRFVFELNNNAKGNYYAINAGDSSTEWGMFFGNNVSLDDVMSGNIGLEEIYKIFNGYLLDDIGLALDFKNRKNIKNVGGQNRAKELRFFKSILEGTKQLATLNTMIKREATMEEFEKYINKNSEAINKAIKSYLDEKVESLKKVLMETNRLFFVDENVYSFPKLESDFAEKSGINKLKMTENQLVSLLMFIQANKEISNIEFHKILFGDPYQFAVKVKGGVEILDEVKRIKSFESPRGTTFDQDDFNNHQNIDGNKTGLPGSENRIALTKNDPGYTEAKPYMNTVTVADTNVIGRLMGKTNEADAASILMDSAYRQTKKRNKNWTNEAEAWHQWQMAYTRNKLAAKGEYTYTNDKLKAHDEALINTPEPSYVTEILKPIVSGNKYGKTYIDNVLDKFSQMPMYYKMVEGKALENLYIKMWKENKDYIVTESGRKLGAERVYDLYVGGMLNTEPFNNNIQVGWDIYGIQVETTYDDKNGEGSTGSQLTKVGSIDLFDKGVASSEAAKKAYDKNVSDKNALLVNGYNRLLSKLGVKDLGDGFEIVDLKKLSESLEHELLRREASDNAKDVLRLDSNGQFVLPFEAAFAYKQIKDIIYSMVDKSIIRPKVNGGGYVQAPVTMWENAKEGRKLAIKTKDGYKEISREAFDKLSDAEKAKVVLTDDTLKFYTKDAPYIEVLLPHWFKKQLSKNSKFKTDEDLLKYLNSSEEGKAILKGIGFRIPTQALSSVENIVVKGFLPQSMGKTIVVPSEITTKAGSDFDIDKLNLYLKSIYVDKLGNIKLVKLHGSEAETKEFYANVFDETIEAKKLKKAELLEAVQTIAYGLDDPKNLGDRYGALIDSLLEDSVDSSDLEATVMAQLEKLGDAELQSVLKEKFVNDMYRRALENEYTDSLIELITLPENFDRLTTPVDDAGLAAVAKYIDSLKGSTEANIKNKVLDGVYLTNLRHAMAIAKAWVGVVAVNITGHSLTQKANVYIDPARIAAIINDAEREILGNGKLLLKHNTTNEGYVSLSGVKNVNGQAISERLSGYATAVVDVVKDPYILKLIKNELAISTFMFLERAGVGNASLFMNQPIISKFLELSEGTSAFGMFSSGNLDTVRAMFGDTTEALLNSTTAINEDSLAENIRKYSAGEKMTAAENAEQQLILKEFLKYAKMAEYAFLMNQAMNYDTSSYKGGDFLHRKQLRTQLALDSNIFVGIQDVLDNTFLKTEIELLDKATEAVGEILKLEKGAYRYITNKVLDPYALNKYLSEDKFIKIANRIKMSFLDYIIQTKGGYNQDIERLLVDPSTNIANQLIMHKASHPELQILKDLEIVDNKLENGTKSVKLKINLRGDAYLENLYTGYMRELKNTPGLEGFYNDLITVAILQGSYKSPYSIGNIIPVDDYAKGIKEAIDTLQPDITLESYYKNGLFQRNNWKDNDIFFPIEPKFRVAKYDADGSALLYEGASYFPNTAYVSGLDRRILTLSEKYARRGTQHDFVKFPRVIEQTKGGVSTGRFIDAKTGEPVTGSQLKKMREAGDLSSKQMYGYQRVMQADGTTPYIIYENGEAKHVYKLINLYGDGQLASEYYNDGRKSVLNNNTVKTTELNDEEVRNILENPTKNPNINEGKQAVPAPIQIQPVETQQATREYTPENITSLKPNEVFVFGSNTEGKHGAGAAKTAVDKFGAKYGQAEGLQGQSYGIVTKDLAKGEKSIPLSKIKSSLADFLIFAKNNTGKKFYVTKLGTMLAGYSVDEIKNLFAELSKEYSWGIPSNVILPKEYEVREGYEQPTKTQPVSKLKGKMSFEYGNNKRPDVKANTTFDAILNGERTATTRYASQGNLDYWKNAKVGDIITWESADGRTVDVEVTKALAPLKGSGKTVEQWSKLEGWSTEYFNANVRPKIDEAWQLEYKLVEPSGAQPVPVAQVQSMGNILEARQTPIDYTAGQKKALNDIANLIAANKQGYYLLAGYAGTGKTTVAENIIKFAAMNGKTPFVLAPTNKAVKVLNDKLRATGAMAQASTIHSALYGEPDPETGEWKPKADIKNGVVLIDESSMIDKELMADLLALTKDRNNVIVFMGDKFQLEPVGVDSGLFTGKVEEVNNSKTELTEVKRQALDSNVLKIATITRNDNVAYVPGTSMEDFKVSKSKDEFVADFRKAIKNNENTVAIVATNNERIQMNTVARMEKFGPKRKVLNDNETLIAVANSNTFSNSEIFNLAAEPSELEEHEITFDFNGKPETYKMYMGYVSAKEGDKVTTIKVMHFPTLDKPSLYHGQILKAVRESNPELYKNLDNGIDIMKTKKGAKLSPAIVITTYGYAVTAHKSQGSQWDKVFVNQNYNAPSWNAARWYYTAITRSAKDVVVLPSQYNTRLVPAAIENKLDAIVKKEEKPVSLTEKKPTGITLKDGKRYNVLFINSNMLEAMGYNPTEIGDILKSIC